jgi:hypothetical protein
MLSEETTREFTHALHLFFGVHVYQLQKRVD